MDTYFERSIKATERNNRGSLDRLSVRSSKMWISIDFQKSQINNNSKEKLFKIIDEVFDSNR